MPIFAICVSSLIGSILLLTAIVILNMAYLCTVVAILVEIKYEGIVYGLLDRLFLFILNDDSLDRLSIRRWLIYSIH